MKLFIPLFILFSFKVFAHEPSVRMLLEQKEIAKKIFQTDKKVAAAIKSLEKDGYQLLSVDMVPYFFVYGEEGPVTNFIVTEWYGKSEKYGWSSKFITAKVGTDHFGWNTAILLDSDTVKKTINDLK